MGKIIRQKIEYAGGGGESGLTIDLNNPCSFNEFAAAFGKKSVWINGLLVVGFVDENEDVVLYTTGYKTNTENVYYWSYNFTSTDHTQPMVYNRCSYSDMVPIFNTTIGSINSTASIHKNNDWLSLTHDSSTDLVNTRIKRGASQVDIKIPTKKYVDDRFEDSGWLTLNDTVKYRKKLGFCEIELRGNVSEDIPTAQYKSLGTLPEGFRPAIEIYTEVHVHHFTTVVRVTRSGDIGLYGSTSGVTANQIVSGSIMFMI